MIIKSNIEAMQTYLNLKGIDSAFNKSLSKLSSGLELPAPEFGGGLFGVANDMEAEYGEYTTGGKNVVDAKGFLQVAQTTMQEVNDKLLAMNDLAMRAGTEIINTDQRQELNAEYQELVSQASNLYSQVKYNNLTVFSNTGDGITYSVLFGENKRFNVSTYSVGVSGVFTNGTTLTTIANASAAVSTIASAVNTMSQLLAKLGGQMTLIDSKASILSQQSVSQKLQESQINELDFAQEMKNFTSLQVVLQASNAMVAQANTKAQMVLQLFK